MAEKSEAMPSSASSPCREEKCSGNWWDSWLSSAKTKSAEVYTMVKKDLDEIGSAVKSEASHVFNTTSTVIGKTLKLDEPESPANVMKKSLSTFIGQVSTALNPEPDDDDDTEVILSSGDTTMLSTYKKELEALQRVDATFIVPANSCEFDAWRASLETREAGGVTASAALRRLRVSPVLRAQYEKLVPDAVSHDQFWERYLFRVALLQDRLAAASRKASSTPSGAPCDHVSAPTGTPARVLADPVLAHLPMQTPLIQSPKKVLSGIEDNKSTEESATVDSDVAWEDEDFAHDVELTEEQQTLLLEEYEREIANKKQTKPRDVTNNNADRKTNTRVADNKDSIDKNKNGRSPKKNKPDECGNMVEDYFGDKDDASANSDESWEKEFEIDDVIEQKS